MFLTSVLEKIKPKEHKSYHIVGELERQGVEPLPPTPITPEAFQKLRSWGISKENILHLQELASSFRYDQCVKKAERLAKQQLYIHSDSGDEMVIVPHFLDLQGRMDGQCDDIAKQFTIQANFTGLLEKINAPLRKTGHSVSIVEVRGAAATHFRNNSNHVWNTLVLSDQNHELKDVVFLDASFQKIMTGEQSGYNLRSAKNTHSGVDGYVSAIAGIGNIYFFDNGNWDIWVDNGLVLGISNDHMYSYLLSFVFDTGKPHPKQPLTCLGRIDAAGGITYFLIDPKRGTLLMKNVRGEDQPLTEESRREIIEILQVTQRFNFTDDVSKFPTNGPQQMRVQWDSSATNR